MPMKPHRRTFLKSSAAAGVGYWAAGGVAKAQSTSPNEQIQFACVGVGGKGQSDSADAGRNGKVVAICDESFDPSIDECALTPAVRNAIYRKTSVSYRLSSDPVPAGRFSHDVAA